jgi:hypothetical protein
VAQSNLITVGRAYGLADAACAMAVLRAAGIHVYPTNWYIFSMAWHLTHAIGGIELRVPASQALDASGILADFAAPTRPKSLQRRLANGQFGLFALYVAGYPLPASGYLAVTLRPVAPPAARPSEAV